jgi:hypothetical protein
MAGPGRAGYPLSRPAFTPGRPRPGPDRGVTAGDRRGWHYAVRPGSVPGARQSQPDASSWEIQRSYRMKAIGEHTHARGFDFHSRTARRIRTLTATRRAGSRSVHHSHGREPSCRPSTRQFSDGQRSCYPLRWLAQAHTLLPVRVSMAVNDPP